MWMEFDNVRDGALGGFFSCGSMNRLGVFGASDWMLQELVRWNDYSISIFPQQWCHVFYPICIC